MREATLGCVAGGDWEHLLPDSDSVLAQVGPIEGKHRAGEASDFIERISVTEGRVNCWGG